MKQRAFTLVELLVVISIIALLASVVLASLNSVRESGRLAGGKQFEANVYHAAGDQAVGQWDFDDCTGSGITATTASDSSGTGNNGAPIASPQWSSDTPTGKGCSISLNGTNQYIDANNPTSLRIVGDITLSAWIKPTALPSAYPNSVISGRRLEGNQSYDMVVNDTSIYTQINTTTGWISIGGATSVPLGVWTHAVITRSGSNIKVYKDGRYIGEGNFTGTPNQGDGVFIGSGFYAGQHWFNGKIDQVRIYAKNLTASEVGALYASEAPKFKLADSVR